LGTESKEFYALRRFSLQLVRSVLALFTMDVSRVFVGRSARTVTNDHERYLSVYMKPYPGKYRSLKWIAVLCVRPSAEILSFVLIMNAPEKVYH
jgi:hypothetical protein